MGDIELEINEIEGLFEKKEKLKTIPKATEQKKPDVIQLLDPRRENNCGIQMSCVLYPQISRLRYAEL